MTTIDAAAARRAKGFIALTVFAALLAPGLGGCETAGSLFSLPGDSAATATLADQGATPALPQPARLSIAPIIGAPDAIAKQLQTQLTAAIESKQISIAKTSGEKTEYALRGYIVSAREKTSTKVSYIWDVTDAEGKRVHRITGEEIVSGAQGKDPWASITQQVVDTIATKTATALAAWMPAPSQGAIAANTGATSAPNASGAVQTASAAQAQPAPTTPPPAATASPPAATAPAPTAPPAAAAVTPSAPPPAATGPTTGSIGREGAVNAMVPTVAGAPGDGGVSLTSALQRELLRSGVALTDRPTGQTYRVEGKVIVGEGKAGKQPIQINWDVKDPQGKKLGTVSQKNEIPLGSLDGAWGKTADAAAAAAAQGILKLLPQTKTN